MSEYADDVADELGYRVSSAKAVRLSEWISRKEQRDFQAIVNRLYGRRWRAKVHAMGGPMLDKLRERGRRWAARHRDRQRAYQRDARAEAYKRNPTILTCENPECGATWCKMPHVRGVRRRFCSDTCRQNHRYRTDEVFRQRAIAAARMTWERRRAA